MIELPRGGAHHNVIMPQQHQRQDALDDQLADLHVVAARLGMYDAADWLWKAARLGEDPADRARA